MSRERKRRKREQGLALAMLNQDGACALMRDRLESGKWWTFLNVCGHGASFLMRLEQQHYAGKRNKDFDVLILPALHVGLGVVCVSFAAKRWTSTKEMSKLFDEFSMPRQAELVGEKDVFAFAKTDALGMAAGEYVERMIYGKEKR